MARKNVLIVPDLTDVDDSSRGSVHIPQGDYLMECLDVRADQSKAGNDMFVWRFKGLDREATGKTFYLYTPLSEQSLWKLKQTVKAVGIYEDGGFEIDPDAVAGTQVIGVIMDSEYTDTQGRSQTNSKLDTVQSVDAVADPAPATRGKKAAAAAGNGKGGKADKTPALDPDEVRKCTADELEDLVELYKLGINLAKSPTLKSKVAATIQALDHAGKLNE
jgi:hypothetical protein